MDTDGEKVLQKLIDENIYHLYMAIEIISIISSEHYIFSENSSSPWMSGVGKHFRHLIDFYDRFIEQFPVVNYDLRNRDVNIEKDKQSAKNKLIYIIDILQTYKNKDLIVSTLGRELRYLIEHTVHHFAIISMFLKYFGYMVPLGFGIAQSTLDYEAKLQGPCLL